MRYKGKLIKWNSEKAFGFIQLDGCSANVFIHKTALFNTQRTPKTNDIITFSISKDKSGRICSNDATFLGEKLKDEKAKTALKKVLKQAPEKIVNYQFTCHVCFYL
jgi:cold shock CspA family protein